MRYNIVLLVWIYEIMKLKQIKLSGFKSFANATVIDITGNLIAVVGPNGCGKSNVIDAIKWVLGESSARYLRTSSMQDVIFNGSANKSAVSRASVELIFDNTDVDQSKISGMWSAYSEISIKRVITKDGDSSYHINNQNVRRRDIIELFLGTGVGARGYAVIEQGMISKIIDASPTELRTFLEEVAGVSKYKERKTDTMRQLDSTKENLVRICDLNQELEKQIVILKNDAIHATNYQELKTNITQKQIILHHIKINQLNLDMDTISYDISSIDNEICLQNTSINDIQQNLTEQNNSKIELDHYIIKLNEEFSQLRTQCAVIDADINHSKQMESKLTIECDNLSHELLNLDKLIHKNTEEQDVLQQKQMDITKEIATQQQLHITQKTSLQDFEITHNKSFKDFTNNTHQIKSMEHEVSIITNSISHKTKQMDTVSLKLTSHMNTIQNIDIKSHQDILTALKDDLQAIIDRIIKCESEIKQQNTHYIDNENVLVMQNKKYQEVKSEINTNIAKCDTFKKLLDKCNTIDAKKYLKDENIKHLWQMIEVTQGYEIAVEVVLGYLLSAVVVDDISKIINTPDGLFTIWIGNKNAKQLMQEPDINNKTINNDTKSHHLTLDKLVIIKDDVCIGLYDILSKFIVVEDFASSIALMDKVSKLTPNYNIVTQNGHICNHNSITFNVNSTVNHVLEYQNQVSMLEDNIIKSNLTLDDVNNQLSSVQNTSTTLKNNINKLNNHKTELNNKKHQCELQITKDTQIILQNELLQKKYLGELEVFTKENNELNLEIKELTNHQVTINNKLLELNKSSNIDKHDYDKLDKDFKHAKYKFTQINQQLTNLTNESKLIEYKLDTISTQHANNLKQKTTVQNKLTQNQEELFKSKQKYNIEELKTLQEELNQKVNIINQQKILLKNKEEEINQGRILQGKYNNKKEQLIHKKQKLELLKHEYEVIRKSHTDILLEQFNINTNKPDYDMMNVIDNNGVHNDNKTININDLTTEIKILTKKLEDMGSVNLKAIEDLETAKRKDIDTKERMNDINIAIQTLMGAIKKIDEKTKLLIKDTFERVNIAFLKHFNVLFGGGIARLEFISNDILNAGLQILASPPGKKNTSLQILSGGEKSLVAMSLVFAFFSLNQAPFCLLDEVDAPLDDANTLRFCKLVKELSKDTQFIYISHNKLTMEMATQLIGVTMYNSGVSNVLTVIPAKYTQCL